MITRLYANNFRCLVAFEARFDSFGVLCGPNGAGKSSVIDVLKLLRDLATGDAVLGGEGEKDIRHLDFTKWLNLTTQEFELEVTAAGHSFLYQLKLEQVDSDEKPRVIHERAACDGKELLYCPKWTRVVKSVLEFSGFTRDSDSWRYVRF